MYIVLGRPERHHVGGLAEVEGVQVTGKQSGKLEE